VRTISVSNINYIAAFDRYASRDLLELQGGKRRLRQQLALIRRFARPAASDSGFCQIERFSWSFVPSGDLPLPIGVLLEAVAAVGELLGVDSPRGGLGVCAWKGDDNAH
jgi:hypothetical protein